MKWELHPTSKYISKMLFSCIYGTYSERHKTQKDFNHGTVFIYNYCGQTWIYILQSDSCINPNVGFCFSPTRFGIIQRASVSPVEKTLWNTSTNCEIFIQLSIKNTWVCDHRDLCATLWKVLLKARYQKSQRDFPQKRVTNHRNRLKFCL